MRITIRPQLDTTTYLDRKAAGTIALQQVDSETIAITARNFDPLTGHRLEDSVTHVNLSQIDTDLSLARAELVAAQDRIHALEALQRDLRAASPMLAIPI